MPNSTPYSITYREAKSKGGRAESVFFVGMPKRTKKKRLDFEAPLYLCFSVPMQNLGKCCHQFAAVEQSHCTKQQQLPDEPERRLDKHERCLHGEQQHSQSQTQTLPADRHKSAAVECAVNKQSNVACQRCRCGARSAVTRNEQRVQNNIDDRRKCR